jgi:hypothetical protein
MPKKIIKGFVHFEQEPWMDKPKFSIMSCDMSSCGYILVGEQDFEADIPSDFNPVAQQIAALEQKKKDLRAKLAKELMEVDDRISSLQAISYEPQQEAA